VFIHRLVNIYVCLISFFFSILKFIFFEDFNLISRSQTHLILNDIQIYLEFLNDLCSTGTPIRKFLVEYMISEEFYQKKIQSESKKTKILNQLNKEATASVVVEEQECDPTTLQVNNSKQNNFKQEIYLKGLKLQKKIKVPKKVIAKYLDFR
jgi:hypothetical protein